MKKYYKPQICVFHVDTPLLCSSNVGHGNGHGHGHGNGHYHNKDEEDDDNDYQEDMNLFELNKY